MDTTRTHRTKATRWKAAAAGVTAALLLGGCTGVVRSAGSADPVVAPSLPPVNPYDPSQDPVVAVVARVAPAVVNITTRTQGPDAVLGGGEGGGVGTGFIVRSDGVIVTNYHVVEGASRITVTLPAPDRRTFDARVIGGASEFDLAVLKVEGSALPTIPLGDSDGVALGQRVIALGYALALPGGPTVTTGIISSTARTVQVNDPQGPDGQGVTRTLQDVFQTDAAINPGNSGGPLVDLAGNVVGINTAGSGQAENVGFAIDINAAKSLIEEAIAAPAEPTAFMGVTTTTVDSGVQSQFGLSVDRGAFVIDVAPGGPADRAGVDPGDVIVTFDGEDVDTSETLGDLILGHEPADEVEVVLVDSGGGTRTLTVTLGVRPLPVETP